MLGENQRCCTSCCPPPQMAQAVGEGASALVSLSLPQNLPAVWTWMGGGKREGWIPSNTLRPVWAVTNLITITNSSDANSLNCEQLFLCTLLHPQRWSPTCINIWCLSQPRGLSIRYRNVLYKKRKNLSSAIPCRLLYIIISVRPLATSSCKVAWREAIVEL